MFALIGGVVLIALGVFISVVAMFERAKFGRACITSKSQARKMQIRWLESSLLVWFGLVSAIRPGFLMGLVLVAVSFIVTLVSVNVGIQAILFARERRSGK